MLYAEKSSLLSFKYSLNIKIIYEIVKKLKQWRQSAGNYINMILLLSYTYFIYIINNYIGSSETIRNDNSMINNNNNNFAFSKVNENLYILNELKLNENVKPISEHIPKHIKLLNDEQLGHYLAGLIDGDGHFSKIPQLVICFDIKDYSLAYYIKGSIGYGSVKSINNKKAIKLVISSKDGILRVVNLINNKIRTINKYHQIIDNIPYAKDNFNINSSNDFNNHWLAGFTDANGYFLINIINNNYNNYNNKFKNKPEIRLNYKINQKTNNILLYIKNYLGGDIGYRKNKDNYNYGTNNFGTAKKVIKYFDKYHLLSYKYLDYIRWRKVYILIQNKLHLTNEGINKIIKIKYKK